MSCLVNIVLSLRLNAKDNNICSAYSPPVHMHTVYKERDRKGG